MFTVSPPDAAARRHSCHVAYDVFRVLNPVQPFHSEFPLWSRGLVWFEEYLLPERGDLLVEWFASDAPVRGHPVASNMECRQSPSCMSHKPLQD